MKESMKVLLVLFTRYPRPGLSKTRLIPAFGPEKAADIQRKMTEHVTKMMRDGKAVLEQPALMARNFRVNLEARITDDSLDVARRWLSVSCKQQGAGDLGEKMARAMNEGFASGYDIVAVMGGDCPELAGNNIAQAVQSAAEKGAGLIPAADGGYCLFALRKQPSKCVSRVFENIEWSTGSVCATQARNLAEQGIGVEILATLSDVDEPADVAVWERVNAAWSGAIAGVSIIIPTLNEACDLEVTIRAARKYFAQEDPGCSLEFIVVDGGSNDETCARAKAYGCKVVTSERGRAAQLEAGVKVAQFEALLFLHADTQLVYKNSQKESIRKVLEKEGRTWGAFAFKLDACLMGDDEKRQGLRNLTSELVCGLYSFNTRLRVRLQKNPFGDQAIFCRKALFQSLNEFSGATFMEDVLFVERAKRVAKFVSLDSYACTSPRRYYAYGFWRTMRANRGALARLRAQKSLKNIKIEYQKYLKRTGN